jgi:hypothetical protein
VKAESDSFIDINQDALDEEWLRQPGLVKKWGKKLAAAKMNASERKAAFKLVEAKLNLEIRESPEEFNLTKVTEDVIKNAVIVQDSYQKAQKRMFLAQKEVDDIQAVIEALDHRKSALSDLVRMELLDYHSTPTAPKGAGRVLDERPDKWSRETKPLKRKKGGDDG